MISRRLHHYGDRAALADAVATRLRDHLVDLQRRQPLVQVCLCGGETAMAVYAAFARVVPGSELDPARLELWWADDYYAETQAGERNIGQVLGVLAGAMRLDPARVHPMPARVGTDDVADAALRYADELGQTRFDVCLLSIGRLGHVAAVFDAQAHQTSTVVGVHDAPIPPAERITVTIGTINRSREVWVLASGAPKAAVVAQALAPDATLPAALVEGTRATAWFLDADAAAHLPRYDCLW